MTPIIRSLAMFDDVHVHDNSLGPDLAVYGRYALIPETGRPVILVQDDDVILPPESVEALLSAYVPGKIAANMPERFRPHYPDSCLVGFGAVFDRFLPAEAFWRFFVGEGEVENLRLNGEPVSRSYKRWPDAIEQLALRTCDVIFTALTNRVLLDLPYEEREFARDANRMYRQPGHVGERQRMLELARRVRDRAAA